MLIQTVDRDAAICKSRPAASRSALTQKEQGAAPIDAAPAPLHPPPVPLVDGNDVRAAIG